MNDEGQWSLPYKSPNQRAREMRVAVPAPPPKAPPKVRQSGGEMPVAPPPDPPKPGPPFYPPTPIGQTAEPPSAEPPNIVATPTCHRMRPREGESMLWAWCIGLSLAAAVVWLLTAWRAMLGLVFVNYAALIALCLCATAAVTRLRLRMPVFLAIAAGVTLPAVSIHAWLDRYTKEWSNISRGPSLLEEALAAYAPKVGQEEGGLVNEDMYHDTYHRWNGTIFYRRITRRARWEGKQLFENFYDGPMSPSGKPHGAWQWEMYTNVPAGSTNLDYFGSHTSWHWYGKEISEGQWHLRNQP